jgi:hypothetical protein
VEARFCKEDFEFFLTRSEAPRINEEGIQNVEGCIGFAPGQKGVGPGAMALECGPHDRPAGRERRQEKYHQAPGPHCY